MKKYCPAYMPVLFVCIVFAGTAGSGYAQIDQGELQRNVAPVDFINYAGPHARIETREQIRQIGVPLGQTVRGPATDTGTVRAGAENRYFVIHSVSDPDGDKLDADIFGLGADAAVDHVRNLRFIIQGYLQEAYGYSAGDALLLAEYITIYNAVYRANWNYFSTRYKTPVLNHLTPAKAGLSVRYDEWPGNTLMLIPLGISLSSGGLSPVDTTAISDERVIEEMRKEDDRGVEQRRDMVDLKEREAAGAEQQAETQREAIAGEEQAIAEEQAQLEQEQRQIDEDKQQLAEEQAAGEVTPQEAAERESEIAQREEAVEQKSEELEQREEELVLQREEAAQREEFAEQKTEEAQRDRESIAQDQQAIIDQGEQPQPKGLIGIIIERQDSTLGRLVTIDPVTREILRRSPIDTVSVRTLTIINGKVLAIAGESRGNGAVRLIEVDTGSLEIAQQGDDDLHPGSLIWVNGSDLYAITVNPGDGTLNLGRFNANLALQAKSTAAVHPNAAVSVQQGGLVTQKADGTAALLNPADLTEQ